MICDHYWEKWTTKPFQPTMPILPSQPSPTIIINPAPTPTITPEEIAEFKELLRKAKEYDEHTGQKDCEIESKKEKIRKLVEELGGKVEFP